MNSRKVNSERTRKPFSGSRACGIRASSGIPAFASFFRNSFAISTKRNAIRRYSFSPSSCSGFNGDDSARAFGTEISTIPAVVPYLRAPPGHLACWSARLGERIRPRIGIALAGDASHSDDAQRSIPAVLFLTAFAGIDADLHVLQKEIRSADAPALDPLHRYDALIADFRDTAALAALMDLVVSVDTAVAHLAGGLGVPLWILVQHGADFRWLRARTDSPWYPTVRLFRQPRYGDWAGALAQVNAALAEWPRRSQKGDVLR